MLRRVAARRLDEAQVLEFVVGVAIGLSVAGVAAWSAHRALMLELTRTNNEAQAARLDMERANERVVKLLAANQSAAIRAAVGAESTEDIMRREEEDRRFRASFVSSD